MTEKGFEPLTAQLGISGTSYRLQLGEINEKWASRLLKGKEVLDSKVYDVEEGQALPNQNYIVGWCLQTLVLPNINPHQIMKTVQALVKQAQTNKEKKKVMPAAGEVKDVELEKVPEEELRRPKVAGWVKEEGASTPAQLEAEKRAAFQDRMQAKKDGEVVSASAESTPASETKAAAPAPAASASAAPVKTIKTTRKLPSIPGGGGPAAAPSAAPAAASSEVKSEAESTSSFCPFCGKDLDFKFCPYCGKPLPHKH
jgi:hypothetical protein